MKLLLTSNGIINPALVGTFFEMIGNDPAACNVAFIPTAAMVNAGDKRWLVDAMHNFSTHANWRSFDVVDLLGLPGDVVMKRLEAADVIVAWGGSEHYLAYALHQSGVAEKLRGLLQEKVWIGSSAGSMVLGCDIPYKMSLQIYNEPVPEAYQSARFLEIIDVAIFPHYGSSEFPGASDVNLETHADFLGRKAYALDDQSALKVIGDTIEVVSMGQWRPFNAA